MKNVVVFSWEGARRAVELRWVREFITLGHVARVPGAPQGLVGATTYRGSILPIVVVADSTKRPREGDTAIVVEVGTAQMALATEGIGEVVTMRGLPADDESGSDLVDSSGRPVETVSPADLLEATVNAIAMRPPERVS